MKQYVDRLILYELVVSKVSGLPSYRSVRWIHLVITFQKHGFQVLEKDTPKLLEEIYIYLKGT